LEALPQLAALSFDIQSRQEALTDGSDGLARDASSCAIGAGSLDKAIEFLEAGRTIFWSQALSLRTPLDKIHDIAPELADQLRNIATALELGSHRNIFSETVSSSDNCTKIEMEEEVSRMHRLGKEWSRGIDEVRCLKGFEDFLRPRRFSSLQAAAAECPVVILIANDDSSHCLIMTLTSVHHIPLLSLPTNKLRRLVYLIQAAASRSHTPRSSIDSQEIEVNSGALPAAIRAALRSWIGQAEKRGTRYANKVPSDDIFRSCLEVLWNEIVKPVINFLCLQVSLKSWVCGKSSDSLTKYYTRNRRNHQSCDGAQLAYSLSFLSTRLVVMIPSLVSNALLTTSSRLTLQQLECCSMTTAPILLRAKISK
jgi:hypothetical protein